jgi:DNA-3-methyladenine glycosylase II
MKPLPLANDHKDYSSTPLPKKLGIREGSSVFLVNPPDGFDGLLTLMPEGSKMLTKISKPLDVAVLFAVEQTELIRWFDRLAAAAGQPMLPEAVLKMRPTRMRTLGLSKQKITYIRDLARQARSGEVDFAAMAAMADDDVIRALTAIKGIGVWTAHMFLIFALRRPNVLPVGDLGIRAAIRKAYGFEELPTPAEIEHLARPWHPWCTVASWYLWRSMEPNANL